MTDLYYLSFRDIASNGLGVTSGEVYVQRNVTPATDWPNTPPTGFEWVPWAQVPDLFRNKRVCFLVHGFNVPVSHAVWCEGPAAQEYEAIGTQGFAITAADLVVVVMWPGDGLIGWSWFNAMDSSKDTAEKFAEFLASSAFTASEVTFVSHSLGARVVLETVERAAKLGARARFTTAVLMAAAVHDDALDDAEYAVSSATLGRIVVLSSMKDEVLAIAFGLGGFAERGMWPAPSRALGRYGPAFKPGSKFPAITEWYEIRPALGQGHGDYLPAGDQQPGPPYGWSTKHQDVAIFCRDLFDAQAFLPQLSNWGIDHTPSFRPGWTPKL
jgi:Alpha/beta hydrolase of unknown function (DUF900)